MLIVFRERPDLDNILVHKCIKTAIAFQHYFVDTMVFVGVELCIVVFYSWKVDLSYDVESYKVKLQDVLNAYLEVETGIEVCFIHNTVLLGIFYSVQQKICSMSRTSSFTLKSQFFIQ